MGLAMGHAINFWDLSPGNYRESFEQPKKTDRLDGKTCPKHREVEELPTNYKKNKSRYMQELSSTSMKDDQRLEQEFTLETSCFDLFPTLADVRPPTETLNLRWESLWGRVSLSLQKAISKSNK